MDKGQNQQLLLVERVEKAVDKCVKITIAFTKIIDLPDRVDHRGVMLSTKAAADLRQ